MEVGEGISPHQLEELSCGVYSLSVKSSELSGHLFGEVKKHEWNNSMLMELIKWERVCVEPKPEDLHISCGMALFKGYTTCSAFTDSVLLEPDYNAAVLHKIEGIKITPSIIEFFTLTCENGFLA